MTTLHASSRVLDGEDQLFVASTTRTQTKSTAPKMKSTYQLPGESWRLQTAKSGKFQASMLFIVIWLMITSSLSQDNRNNLFTLAATSESSSSSNDTAREVSSHDSPVANEHKATSTSQQQQQANSTTQEPPEQQYRLNCQPGEQRQFSYESSTRVWGSTEQQVRLRATLRLKCMEPPTNTTLKYLAEIVALTPNFMHRNEPVSQKLQQAASNSQNKHSTRAGSARSMTAAGLAARLQDGHSVTNKPGSGLSRPPPDVRVAPLLAGSGDVRPSMLVRKSQAAEQEAQIDQMLRAEPLLEEVGDAATRVGRSLSGWFSKAWGSVKDFFGNIFTSSERSSVSRDQALKESGLDIMGQCKAPSSKGRNPAGLPFDESVFEDLGPEYYIGASLDSSNSATGGYEFAHSGTLGQAGAVVGSSEPTASGFDDEEDHLASSLSFFDDPVPIVRAKTRTRRATSTTTGGKKSTRSMQDSQATPTDYNKLIRLPFVFVQSRAGKIIEIRFSGEELDLSVKNFKRHLCDLFATNLDWNKTNQNEVSPIGKHQTKYQLDASANSIDSIKESALKLATNNNEEERSNKQQLVRVLAMVGTNDRNLLKEDEEGGDYGRGNNRTLIDLDDDSDQDYVDQDTGAHGDGHNNNSSTNKPARSSISVLRTINTTSSIQLSSKMLAPDIDRIQVRVKQVQQINSGRLVGTAGQLSMNLMQLHHQQQQSTNFGQSAGTRSRRDANDEQSRRHEQVEDISDLLRLSTSFSMQLVPIPRNPDGSIDDGVAESAGAGSGAQAKSTGRSATSRWRREASSTSSTATKTKTTGRKRAKKSPLVRQPPSDPQELQRVLQEWRKQEARLQLSSSNLVAEDNGQQESQQTRLDILRDQIRQRLNEEFVRNRIRRSLNQQQQQIAAASSGQARSSEDQSSQAAAGQQSKQKSGVGGDLGLGLTQLVLGSGVTTKRKGSIYATIEEAMELEARLAEDYQDTAISRLLRDTIRMDKLKQHCKSSIPSLEELADAIHHPSRGSSSKLQLERRLPFGFRVADNEDDVYMPGTEVKETTGTAGTASQEVHAEEAAINRRRRLKTRSLVERFERQNDRKLEQCHNVLQLMLRLNDRQASELALELIDECNQRLLAAAKLEELGYGPMSKFYRRLRQRFIVLLSHTSKPTDSLLDKLLARLYYPKISPETTSNSKQQGSSGGHYHHHRSHHSSRSFTTPEPPEFVYVSQRPKDGASSKYNKSLLKDEDDFNNSDGAGLLVMTITSLAAKSSVSRTKRVEIAERLLQSLKGTTCSLFNSPDLDIIESMANFQEPLDEIVGRILQLARRCKQHDQYVVACVHGLSGQLQHPNTQRFLVDLLRSQNSSCTLKSEIVLTLIGAQLANDLRQFSTPVGGQVGDLSQHPAGNSSSASTSSHSQWPNSGLNKVDETLLELLDGADRQREPDRRCLKQLVGHYLSKKQHHQSASGGGGSASSGGASRQQPASGGKQQRSLGRSHQQGEQGGGGPATSSVVGQGTNRYRGRRAVMNEQNFWDEAQCKRWSVPADNGQLDLSSIFGPTNNQPSSTNFYTTHNTDLIDEIDDASILTALMNNQNKTSTSGRNGRRNQKLIERELDSNSNSSSSSAASASSINSSSNNNNAGSGQSTNLPQGSFLRRRHKCVASKDFGPKNAQANLKAEIVNDLVGSLDENKFLARFRLSTNFLGNRIDVGRMYLWHQRRTTRAYANILGRSIWDSSHGCKDKAPNQVLYMPLFDFNLWLVKVSVGLRLNAEMGFYPNCDLPQPSPNGTTDAGASTSSPSSARVSELRPSSGPSHNDELQLYPTIALKAAGEATARLVVARAGMSLASQYSYQGDIRVSRQPESCMSVYSSHQPMNITFSSWFQLWDNDCHFWGSRGRAEPRAVKWRLTGRSPIAWLEDECLQADRTANKTTTTDSTSEGKPPSDKITSSLSARSIRPNRIDP